VNRVLAVVRLQLVSWKFGLGMPLGILTLVLAINLALFGSLGEIVPPEGRTTGGMLSIYIVFGVGYLQTMTQLFTFALGLSVTRRAYYAGVTLLVAAEAVAFGALVLLLNLLERASGGWGIGLKFFALDFLTVDDPGRQWLIFTVPFLLFGALGVFSGVVFKRWGQAGVYAMTVSVGVGLAALSVLVSWQGWWPAVGSWFAGQTATALFAGYPLAIALLLGAGGWLAVRRATP
jgi:hypothetical protein